MSRVDWRQLLTERRVPFIDRGANVKRGEINTQCPICGSADPSYHLGINLDTGFWACWRNDEHRGKSPVRLLIRLLRVSYAEALQIAGLDTSYVDPDGFQALVARMREQRHRTDAAPETPEADPPLTLDDFHRVEHGALTRRHWEYLDNRWFDVAQLVDEYGVRAGTRGDWHNRVIFPYVEEGEIVTWTGRAIGPAEIRYRDLPLRRRDGYGGPIAHTPAKKTLFNHDAMKAGGTWLILVEGPIDALKLDAYGRQYGLRAVGLSTASITQEQLARLDRYVGNFENFGVMMDMDDELHVVHSMRMKSQLASLKRESFIVRVPAGRKDAGELNAREVRAFAQDITKYTERGHAF